MQTIVGHLEQRTHLTSVVQEGLESGTFLFSGPESIGKSLIAKEFARAILCSQTPKQQGGCGSCAECSLYEAHNHPDSYLINCADRESGRAEFVRDTLRSLSLRPYRGGSRVVIFTDCEHLSPTAANILLKTLEEPLQSTTFILVAANVTRLPKTVLSRCRRLIFASLQLEDLRALQRSFVSDETTPSPTLLHLADGTAKSLEILMQNSAPVERFLKELRAIAQGSEFVALSTASDLASDKDALPSHFSIIRLIARSEMFQSDSPEEKARWATFLLNVLSAERAIIDRNANNSSVLAALFTSLLPHQSVDTTRQDDMVLSDYIV